MKFNTNLLQVLSSDSRVKVLVYALNPGFRMTGRELARTAGISHTMAIKILKELESLNIVSHFNAGKSVVWLPRTDSYSYKAVKKLLSQSPEYIPLEDLKQNLKKDIPEKYVQKAVIYGSVAEKRENENSDIDLYILVRNDKDRDEVISIMEETAVKYVRRYGNVLNPHVLTEREIRSKKLSGLMKNIEKGTVIYDKKNKD